MTDSLIEQLRRRARDPTRATDEADQYQQACPPPLDGRSIIRAEEALGFALFPLLRDAYRCVGNGGFGPGYGLLPLVLHEDPNGDESAVNLYTAFRSTDPEDPAWIWPAQLLPFCDWGCAIRSCVDCASKTGTIVTFDPNVRGIGEPISNALALSHASLADWFLDWLAGVRIWDLMFEPDVARAKTLVNPFTKQPLDVVPTKLRRP
jgi:hypothetical protein